jgi:hypothetical protein
MVSMVRNVSDPPILWSIPFTLLVVTIILAAIDILIPHISLNVGTGTWLWASSTLITAIMASLVAEMVSVDNRRAMLSMGFSAVIFTLIYKDLTSVLRKSIIDVIQGAMPNPIIGMAVYTSILAIVPSALTGMIFGGIFGSFPISTLFRPETQFSIAPREVEEPSLPGLEKVCSLCGHHAPFESRFCPYCGIELTVQRAPTVQYCRFCGARITYLGQFCPDCGKQIDLVSKPKIYVSS